MEIKVGDVLRDNDPRSKGREVTILALGLRTEAGLQSVVARGRGGPAVSISVRRIHCDGRPRRSGFDLVKA